MAHPVQLDISEAEFQAQVVALAELTGHLVYHTYDSRKSQKGFPDLNIVKFSLERPIYAELKTQTGKLTPEQELWKNILESMPGVDYRLWRPSSWPEIEKTLVGRSRV